MQESQGKFDRKGCKGKHDEKGKGKGGKHDKKGKHDKDGKDKENIDVETRKCHKCGQDGHIRRDCPTQKISAVDETNQPNQVGAVFETAEHAWILALREVRTARTARPGRPGFHDEFPVVHGQREIVSISGEPLQ